MSKPRPPVYRITLVQVAVLVLLVAVLHYAGYSLVAEALFLGGLIAILSQAYFSWRLFWQRGAQAASGIARAGYSGAIGKFLIAVAGFALVFAFHKTVEAWAVFAGYGVMLIIQVAGSWLLLRLPGPPTRT